MEVVVGGMYKHFKGNLYKVLMVVNDADTPTDEEIKKLVIYQNTVNNTVWARNIENFTSKVDKIKYPDIKQTFRFELIDND